MPEGDLFDYLFEGNKPLLSWDKRISILFDIAKALTYLHGQGLVYRDLKAKNVLLDSELRAKLCDFGSLVPDRASVPYEGISGYFEVCTLRDETPQIFHDVYAFGVLMLEVMLQRCVFKNKSGIIKSLVSKYYTMRLKRRAANMPSKKMNGEFEVQSLEALLKIAERCLLEEPTNYMRMETVTKGAREVEQVMIMLLLLI
ncbi:probable serine/threonine-protein kinase PBL4 [Dioscorea cayenensis subsp. rotundata]|uniref:Probable serine/threonine-protein kinase PBL4 n=1 Tax=Dioscorea cayennensis subsp. rotundata TaxID=55577 RepID=A0AB40D097_DIOCR|nr:probable serine/threonine-protein kinase PBL4 [Dioscorea cayenensis subsp. rotundata]